MSLAVQSPTLHQAALSRLVRHSDVVVAFAAVVVIGMMVVPLPPLLLDLLVTLNITGSLMVLLVTLYRYHIGILQIHSQYLK